MSASPSRADTKPVNDIEVLTRRLEREKKARKQAETLLEQKSRELYLSNVEIRESEERTRAILNTVASGIITANDQGVIESVNHATEQVFGYQADEMVGQHLRMLMPASYDEHGDDFIKTYVGTGQARVIGTGHEVLGQRKDGSTFPLDLAVTELCLTDRVIRIGVLRDLTRYNELQRQLVQAQKLESIGQLAAGVAHEINTPIQFVGDNVRFVTDSIRDLLELIGGYQSFLRECEPGARTEDSISKAKEIEEGTDLPFLEEELPRALQQSLEGVDRVTEIVRAMKEFAHPGGEDKQPINVNEAIQSTITVSRSEWKYVAEIATAFDLTLPLVPCLPGEFNQVILNIIVNAAHAIGDVLQYQPGSKGTITITTQRDGGWAEIRVRDTGTGIPEDARAKIFDPFFTTKEVGKGTGQGLAIAHSTIADKHGGTLTFETESGKGTTFVIRLPLVGDSERRP